MDSNLLIYRDIRFSPFPDRPDDASEFIGQSHSGNIMAALFLKCKSPNTEPVGGFGFLGMREDRTGTMDQEHSKIHISPLGDVTETPVKSAGISPGSEAEEAGEVTGCGKSIHITDKSNESSGRQQTDPGDRAEALIDGIVFRKMFQLPFDGTDPCLELGDFIRHLRESEAQGSGNGAVRIGEENSQCGHDMLSSGGDGNTQFPEDSTSGVDSSGTVGEVFGTEPVESSEGMLIGGFHGYRSDVFISKGFEDTLSVSPICFVANDIGSDGVRREKNDGVSELMELACPVVGGATRFEDNRCRLSLCEELFEPGSGNPVALADRAGRVGDGDFKDGLGEIDGDGCVRIHFGLLLHESDWYVDAENAVWHIMMPIVPREESISSHTGRRISLSHHWRDKRKR
jgi:hypothetical protein